MSPARRCAAALIVASGLTALAYSSSCSGEFQFDDVTSIVENVAIRDLDAFLRRHLLEVSRPVTQLTFALDFALAELDVRVHHATNVALHLATVVLVFLFSRRLLRRLEWPGGDALAVWIAGVFGLHPLQTQAVSYLCQRAEILASLFYLLALLLMMEAEERGLTRRGIASYAAALLALVLGLGSKQIVVTFPATYLLLAACFPAPGERGSQRSRWSRRLALMVPYAAAAAVTGHGVLSTAQPKLGVGFGLPFLGPGRYLLTELSVVRRYLELLLWPAGQNVDHAFPLSDGLADPRTLLSGALLFALAGAAIASLIWSTRGDPASPARKAARLGAFGVLFFFVVLSPTSSIVPVVDVIAEHRVYLASWGIFAALGAGGTLLCARAVAARAGARPAVAALAGAIWLAAGVLTYQRNAVWASQLSLWRDAVAKSPTKARPHENLGHALYLAGDRRGAAVEFSVALRYWRDGSVPYAKLLNNVGASLLEFGRIPEAVAFLNDALARAPDDSRLLDNLAIAYLWSADLDAAERIAHRAARLFPGDPGAHEALGLILEKRGDTAGAARELALASMLDPDLPLQTRKLALRQEREGLVSKACESWRRYLAMRPGAANEALARGHLQTLGCGGG